MNIVESKEEATTSRVVITTSSMVAITNRLPAHRVRRGTMDDLRIITLCAGGRGT